MGNQVAAAVVHGTVTKTTRLTNNASIFRAELYAISLVLAVIRRRKEKNFIIFSDSMSSLEAVSGFKLEIDIVQNIIKDYTHLTNSGKIIILCWCNLRKSFVVCCCCGLLGVCSGRRYSRLSYSTLRVRDVDCLCAVCLCVYCDARVRTNRNRLQCWRCITYH